jgi:hypothetical protein
LERLHFSNGFLMLKYVVLIVQEREREREREREKEYVCCRLSSRVFWSSCRNFDIHR